MLVGEKGPEVLQFGKSGHVAPLGSSGVKGRGGDTYYIDASNADKEGLMRLEKMLLTINGSVEYRAVAAVSEASARGAI
jgi:hypothetical protein